MKLTKLFCIALFSTLLFYSCKPDETGAGFGVDIITGLEVQKNPTGFNPLSAVINFTTARTVQIKVRIAGKNGPDSDINFNFPGANTFFSVPILGLYAGHENLIEITLMDLDGNEIGVQENTIITEPLSEDLPSIRIDKANSGDMKPGYTLVNYFGYAQNLFPQEAFMFDEFGEIRWYLDYTGNNVLGSLFYDVGLFPLQNGNFVFGDLSTDALYEVSVFGDPVSNWRLQGYQFHHYVMELPNGNLLATVSDNAKSTVEDVIIEISRNSGRVENVWDLNESLDRFRTTWTDGQVREDWIHVNSIAYDEDDDAIIISGRTQGLVKLNRNNEVIWILAPHKDWGMAGNGEDLSQFLLQPLDAQGMPINDMDVLDGTRNHTDFEWAWYQHSPVLMPNGNIMLFDNGDTRNYTRNALYSRSVEFKIDEENKTVQQIWSYGKNRGEGTYSRIVSKADYYPEEENVIFAPGAIQVGGNPFGKIIEVDRNSSQVLFEATITPPLANYGIVFHSVHRVRLYP